MTEHDKDAEIRDLRARLEALEDSNPSPSGAAQKKVTSEGDRKLTWIVAAVLGVPLIALTGYCSQQPAAPTANSEASTIAGSASEPTDAANGWRYTSSTDEMTDARTEIACTTSTNEAALTWPYSSVTADLCVRDSARHGLDVFVVLNGDGQIICRAHRDCSLKVRFGEAEAGQYPAADAADGSSNIVFIRRAERFVSNLKTAQETRVELTFYQAGVQTLTFKTDGLVWPRQGAG